MSQPCPCHSNKLYSDCCEPAHLNHSSVTTPEQLMRSRYAAHELRLVDYVINTYHPSCNAEEQREGIADSVHSDWCGLEVTNTEAGSHENEGFVTFNAYLNEDGQQLCLTERSRFLKEDGLWYYIDGTFPQAQKEPVVDERLNQPISSLKVGRNDPCICGSGKKYKKCCG
ncbi:YchJ family protein [Vibrio maerlii]|uniref:YchJ family protein n=1 Tax=Vibrio maerlii TaxID=2231648 RepID=UPI000E3C24AE|nr:YchJ family protein [Vibrio maerlii]